MAGRGVAGFGTGGVAGFGTEDAAGFGTGGVEAGLLASELADDCPRTVDGPKLMSKIGAQTQRVRSRRSPMIPLIMRLLHCPEPASL